MKFLESQELDYLNAHYLNHSDVGDKILNAKVEVYSCKSTKADHEWKKDMEQHFQTLPEPSISHSIVHPDKSTLFRLISTLNWSFPDYDWTSAPYEQFVREDSIDKVVSQIDEVLVDPVDRLNPSEGFKRRFWEVVRSQSLGLDKCEVFKYVPLSDADLFVQGKLYAFNYFLYNRKLKRLVFVAGAAISKLHGHSPRTLESMMDFDEGEE